MNVDDTFGLSTFDSSGISTQRVQAPETQAPPMTETTGTPPTQEQSPAPTAAEASTAKPGLSLAAKIGIAVGVVLAVGILVALLVYFLRSSSSNNGTSKFGSISIKDTSTNVGGTNFAPGDNLQLQYSASTSGFSNRCVWTLSTDNGKTFPNSITDPTFGNTVQYTIPATIFTQTAVFKVADEKNPDDFVLSDVCTIDPNMTLLSGPGVTRSNDTIHVGVSVVSVVNIDTSLKGLSTTSWVVKLTEDPNFKTGITNASLQSVSLGENKVTLTWTTSTEMKAAYYRVETTGLVGAGYPYELSATSPNPVAVVDSLTCKGITPPADPSQFYICAYIITDASGTSGTLVPADVVTLSFSFVNAFPGSSAFSFTYSLDGGTAVPWTVTFASVLNGIATYTGQLPDQTATTFSSTVSGGSSQATTPNYAIQPGFTILNLSPPVLIPVYPAFVQIYQTTQMQMNPAANLTASQWQVGYADDTTGKNLKLFPIHSVTYSGSIATIMWNLTWDDGFPHPAQPTPFDPPPPTQITKALVFSMQPNASQPLKVQQFVNPTTFNITNYINSFSPMVSTVDPTKSLAVVNFSGVGYVYQFIPRSTYAWSAVPFPNSTYVIVNQTLNDFFGALFNHTFFVFEISTPTVTSVEDQAQNLSITRIAANSNVVNITVQGQTMGQFPLDIAQDILCNNTAEPTNPSQAACRFTWVGQPLA